MAVGMKEGEILRKTMAVTEIVKRMMTHLALKTQLKGWRTATGRGQSPCASQCLVLFESASCLDSNVLSEGCLLPQEDFLPE